MQWRSVLSAVGLATCTVLLTAVIICSPATSQQTAYQAAAAEFPKLPLDLRYEIQMLLISAGYSVSVSTDQYNTKIFDAVARFQSRNGFPGTGVLTVDQFKLLHKEADPVLTTWGLNVVHHPESGLPLWVPARLGLVEKRSESGLDYEAPNQNISILFHQLRSADLATTYRNLLSTIETKHLAVKYQLLKGDFFVISTSEPPNEAYRRYHRTPSGIVGFSLFWHTNAPIYGDRLSALMSDLFRSAVTFSQSRTPPEPTTDQTVVAHQVPPQVGQEAPADATSTGTGVYVSNAGHILTNVHVIENCSRLQVSAVGAAPTPVRVVARDAANDLALLQSSGSPPAVATFRSSVRVGENVYAYGFPLAGFLSTTGNFTGGNVTASAGIGDDTRMLQISAPVQPGNSGGPLLDQSGNLVGLVVAKLNALKVATVTEDLAQNVNFAIKSALALNFLEANNVGATMSTNAQPLQPADIAERARSFSVYVECMH